MDDDARPLVVDDHAGARASLAACLGDAREAGTVADALAALDMERPSLVVLDLTLDAPSGALHDALSAARVPVVLVSGLDADDAARVALARGWPCLSKPCTPEALAAAVRAALDGPVTEALDPRPSIVPDLPPPHAPVEVRTERPPLPDRVDTVPPSTHDVWRDRLRVVADRLIYAGALWALVHLQMAGKLDAGMVVAVLLVAGVRPHNLFEAARAGVAAGGGRAALLALAAPVGEALRSGTWLAR